MVNNRNLQRAFRVPGPRRFVEKIKSQISQAIDDTVIETILHQVEDRETLVRTIVQLDAKTAVVGNAYHIAIYHEPRGITMEQLAVGVALDAPMSKVEIWHYVGFLGPSVGDIVPIFVDLKGMRKLEPGDQIAMRVISATANGATLQGFVTLFFKT